MPNHNQLRPRPAPPRPTINAPAPTDLSPTGKSYAQLVLDQVNAGADIVNAAASAGISMAQLGEWNREGQIQWARYLNGAVWETDLNDDEQDYATFHYRLEIAQGQHRSRLAIITEQLARGGLEKKRTRTRTFRDGQVETDVTVEHVLPDGEMARWKLETLQPDVYGKRGRLDLMLHDLSDSDMQMQIVDDRIEAIMAQFDKADAIDASSTVADG